MAPKVPLGHCLEDCRKEDLMVKCHQAAGGHTVGVREGELLRSSAVFPGPSPLCNPSHLNFSLSSTCSPLPTSSHAGLQRAARGMGVSQAIGTGKPQQFSENPSPFEPGRVTRPGRRLLHLIKPGCGPTPGGGVPQLTPAAARGAAPPKE